MEESALSNDILKLSNGLLEHDKPFKLFDMKKFQNNVNREMKRQYPDRRYCTAPYRRNYSQNKCFAVQLVFRDSRKKGKMSSS
jgi:hypothetical protein